MYFLVWFPGWRSFFAELLGYYQATPLGFFKMSAATQLLRLQLNLQQGGAQFARRGEALGAIGLAGFQDHSVEREEGFGIGTGDKRGRNLGE